VKLDSLKYWEEKESWKATMSFCPVYFSKTTGERSVSLSALCSREKTLTLTKNGFSEIGVCLPTDLISESYNYLTEPLQKIDIKIDDLVKKLVGELKKYFIKLWDCNVPHIVFMSGGQDSRIISYILKDLRDDLGRGWLREIHFVCFKPEDKIFLKVMEVQGWNKNEYEVYKENQDIELDYFDYCNPQRNLNAFVSPALFFWRKEWLEKNAVYISGVFGGEALDYPVRFGRLTNNRYSDLFHFSDATRMYLAERFNICYDILSPFLGYEYLDTVFRIPDKYFVWKTKRGDEEPTLLRTKILESFGDKVPYCYGHYFPNAISERYQIEAREFYYNSKFYKKFSSLDFVKDSKPWTSKRESLDIKLFSYAIMYEEINEN